MGKEVGRWEREVMFEEDMFNEIQPHSSLPGSHSALVTCSMEKREILLVRQKAEWRPGNETKPSSRQHGMWTPVTN